MLPNENDEHIQHTKIQYQQQITIQQILQPQMQHVITYNEQHIDSFDDKSSSMDNEREKYDHTKSQNNQYQCQLL